MSLLLLLWPLALIQRPEAEYPLWARRSLILLISGLSLRYWYWRCTASLNLDSSVSTSLSGLLLLAEGWLLITGLLPLWLAWRRFPDRRRDVQQLHRDWQASEWRPHVDILVPTYGEPLAVLQRSLLGCTQQSYPRTSVLVLDDSGREEVKRLAEQLGCRYLHRPERLHAKAGNLNAGLSRCDGELVAVFDADFIPQQRFLEQSIGFLLDPDVALLQTPQSFINADPVMRNLRMESWLLPDEESFYRWIEPVRDGWGAVVCAGTAFVVRRRALDGIGGFVEGALSEDYVTGIALRAQGWKLLYLQQKLSAGLTAESMEDFVRQRQRWANGTLQSLALTHGPLRAHGLSPGQRLAYLEGVIHWLNNLPRLVLMLMPLSYGLLGVAPILLDQRAIIELMLPLWGTVLLSIGWLNRNSRSALLTELTSWVLTVPLVVSLICNVLGSSIGFRVTPKHRQRSRGGWSWFLTLPLIVLSLFNLANLQGLVQQLMLGGRNGVGPLQLGLVWAGLNLLGTLIALRACWNPPQSDPSPWLSLDHTAQVVDSEGHCHPCRITAISESGVELAFSTEVPPLMHSSQLQWTASVPPLPVVMLQIQERQAALSWGDLSQQQQHSLIRWLFCSDGVWPERRPRREVFGLLVLLKRLLCGGSAPQPFDRSLVPRRS
ncbi:glycosyltransferase [Synechococcus sp. RS9902]|uniref:glycosyltransferase n=1 Tax=Synechococcus sp. RS9902 TaxID=221345 RepID=UPI001645C346|nr:cellulose synthase catalytic subunit [Synechococcus sp. RS9902]QNI98182.1 putative polysaccharide-forming beta-glycosyltransferase/ family 2 [Synechococcus sp. RS9902]